MNETARRTGASDSHLLSIPHRACVGPMPSGVGQAGMQAGLSTAGRLGAAVKGASDQPWRPNARRRIWMTWRETSKAVLIAATSRKLCQYAVTYILGISRIVAEMLASRSHASGCPPLRNATAMLARSSRSRRDVASAGGATRSGPLHGRASAADAGEDPSC